MGKVIAICNQKGGVGKTTTTATVGVGLSKKGCKVMIVDADQQGDLSTSLGLYEYTCDLSVLMRDVMRQNCSSLECVCKYKYSNKLDIIPSSSELAAVELELISSFGRENILKSVIAPIREEYDYILIDCPPTLGMMTINALTAADSAIIPVIGEFLPAKGTTVIVDTIFKVKRFLNPTLKIDGIIFTKSERTTNSFKKAYDFIKTGLGQYIHVFETVVPKAIRASEAPEHGMSVLEYDESGNVAIAYEKLVEEVMKNGDGV